MAHPDGFYHAFHFPYQIIIIIIIFPTVISYLLLNVRYTLHQYMNTLHVKYLLARDANQA